MPTCKKCRTKKANAYVPIFFSARNQYDLCRSCFEKLMRVLQIWLKKKPG